MPQTLETAVAEATEPPSEGKVRPDRVPTAAGQARSPDPAAFDAVILAGGRASRLRGIDKPALRFGERSLLAAAVIAVQRARSIVVVGPDRDAAELDESAGGRVRFTREDPPFGGPAAAVGAGVDALGEDPAPTVVVVAADQPNVGAAVAALLETPAPADGVLAVDDGGRRQFLLGRYRTTALRERVAECRRSGDLTGLSLRTLVDGLELGEVVLGDDLCSDVDTEEDARRFGIRLPPLRPEGQGSSMTTGRRTEPEQPAREDDSAP